MVVDLEPEIRAGDPKTEENVAVESKPKIRVKDGRRHSNGNRFCSDDNVEVSMY